MLQRTRRVRASSGASRAYARATRSSARHSQTSESHVTTRRPHAPASHTARTLCRSSPLKNSDTWRPFSPLSPVCATISLPESNSLSFDFVSNQIPLPLAIVRVCKLYLLTYTYLLTCFVGCGEFVADFYVVMQPIATEVQTSMPKLGLSECVCITWSQL